MNESSWLERNTYHHSAFRDIQQLVALKERRDLRVSVCFPTLNEEATIAKEIVVIKSELQARYPLVDEIAVIDSGSTDKTLEVAAVYGAKTFKAEDILPEIAPFKGKGENLWKALYALAGDIIVYVDADIKNIHPRFVYGLLGPLLAREDLRFAKAYYERPISFGAAQRKATGGGRVTELVIRPLFSLFYPELAQLIQPLSGEYAAYRDALEAIPFPVGYGIETSMLIDLYDNWGMGAIAQVDLEKRVHRNQDTAALGRMSFGIFKTFFKKLEESGKASLGSHLGETMLQFAIEEGSYAQKEFAIELLERPPMISIEAYREHRAAERRSRL
jgi:glucosyl-3-phosphoglycerate synthase